MLASKRTAKKPIAVTTERLSGDVSSLIIVRAYPPLFAGRAAGGPVTLPLGGMLCNV